MYYVVQGLTFAILILAANTSYQGFPRLAAILARDRYFPRQFVNLGDRLVYSNGIIVLAGVASLADLDLSRGRHLAHPPLRHRRLHRVHAVAGGDGAVLAPQKEPGWRAVRGHNGVGAATTGLVTLLVIQAKFTEGAWMVTIAVPPADPRLPRLTAITASSRVGCEPARRRSGRPGRRTPPSSTSRRSMRRRRVRRGTRSVAGNSYHPVKFAGRRGGPARTLVGLLGRGSSNRDAGGWGTRRSGSGLCLGPAARRVELRHGGRAGGVCTPSL